MPDEPSKDALNSGDVVERVVPPGVDRIVFVVGCARSGTTWLQLLLNQHPHICTTQETNLFLYLADLHRRWIAESKQARAVGLRALLDEASFKSLLTVFARSAITRSFDITENTRVLVEKTPLHVRHAELINWMIPDALFLHIIRDPRDVVGSLRRAGKEWNASWRTIGVAGHARRWVRDVSLGRSIADWAGDRYHEVRYEDLRANGVPTLQGIFEWLRIRVSEPDCKRWIEACELAQVTSSTSSIESPWRLAAEPTNFWGERPRGAAGLSPSEIWKVERISKDQMLQSGYEPLRDRGLGITVPAYVRYSFLGGIKAIARRLVFSIGNRLGS